MRQANAALPKGDGPAAVAIRIDEDGQAYSWEIRRFGGVKVKVGTEAFATQAEGAEAGDRELPAMRAGLDESC